MTKINFVGDIALFREFQRKNIDPFAGIELPDSDYNIGNFEFVIPNERERNFFDVSSEYKVDFSYFSRLNLNRFQALGLANNHIMDYGEEGVEDMSRIFNERKISTFGIGKNPFNSLRFKINDISFVLIGCVKSGRWIQEEGMSPDLYDRDAILLEIKKEKQTADHVIVFPHMGTELINIPAPEDIKNSRDFIDAGASAVIGHHPHTVQGIEEYKHGVIAYSLGSFIYLPKFEVGYSDNQKRERDFSMCLRLTFSKKTIEKMDVYYYKLNPDSLLPFPYKEGNDYFDNLNKWIEEPSRYYNQIRTQLLKREIVSFFQRFRRAPLKTIKHYLSYLKPRHLRIILRRDKTFKP